MNNNINIETKKEINKIILNCALLYVKPKVNKNPNIDSIIETNYDYVQEYMTIEQFRCYVNAKINIITSDIF